jgi:glycosyltransferase involved in cell wall biosynthesis
VTSECRTRVTHLTSVHPPLDTRIFWKECRTLARAGFDVVLVAPDAPDDSVHGITLLSHPRPGGRVERVIRTPLAVSRLALSTKADLYHFHDPDLLPAGVIIRVLSRKPVIFDSHEDVPRQLLDRPWIPQRWRPLAARFAGAIEQVLVRGVSAVVSAEPAAAARFPHDRTTTVQNFPLLEEFEAVESERQPRKHVLVYVGDVTEARGAVEMVDAIGLVSADLHAQLILVGPCHVPGLLEKLARRAGWARVEYVGWQNRAQVVQHLRSARAGIVVLHPTAQYRDATQPVKLFEYMAAQLPVIASNFPAWHKWVEGAGAGIAVDPLDPSAIAGAIESILRDPGRAESMGRAGRSLVTQTYNWEPEGARLVELYRRLLSRSGRRA